ncbi:vacuolar import and degradation protein-domain-containing protein [Pyronema domesticum]|nr:vacuolar import and degradation protein-domain-containing protein [Pyronema domesticum]
MPSIRTRHRRRSISRRSFAPTPPRPSNENVKHSMSYLAALTRYRNTYYVQEIKDKIRDPPDDMVVDTEPLQVYKTSWLRKGAEFVGRQVAPGVDPLYVASQRNYSDSETSGSDTEGEHLDDAIVATVVQDLDRELEERDRNDPDFAETGQQNRDRNDPDYTVTGVDEGYRNDPDSAETEQQNRDRDDTDSAFNERLRALLGDFEVSTENQAGFIRLGYSRNIAESLEREAAEPLRPVVRRVNSMMDRNLRQNAQDAPKQCWEVKVKIFDIDWESLRISIFTSPTQNYTGSMTAFTGEEKSPLGAHSVETYLEGELLDFNTHSFETWNYKSNLDDDADNWRNLEPFKNMYDEELARNLLSKKFLKNLTENWVFMRWKEKCFISPQPDGNSGLTIGGFYYLCLARQSGEIKGFYYDPQSQPYQELILKPKPVNVFPSYQMR